MLGNESVKQHLTKMLESKRVPHLLLFSGPIGAGIRQCAIAFAKEWLGISSDTHPDLHLLGPEGKTGMLSISSVRQVIMEISLTAYQAKGKVAIFDDAERMLPSSANALLKVLEEPPPNTLIILVSSHPERLLGTILSRSQQVRFHGNSMPPRQSDEIREKLFELLTQARNKSFFELSANCQAIQKSLEARRKEKEAALKEEVKEILKEMNASSRELLEQEIEGAAMLSWIADVERLFTDIFAFYRDLSALSVGPGHPPLYFEDNYESLVQSYNEGRGVELDLVEKLLKAGKLAVERSMPLQNALETLFLQLT